MERLVSAGAKVDGGNRRALRDAAANAQVSALRWLIAHGARVDGPFEADGETALHAASGATISTEADDDAIIDAVNLLLDAGADPNALRGPGNGFLSTPLLIAANSGRERVAQILIARGAKPDLPSSDGSASTPLMVAAERDHPALVRLLLDHGATIDAADTAGETALMMATRRGAHDTMDVLIKRGADVNLPNKDGLTALMLAAYSLDEKTVARLLDAKADVDATSAGGWTALMQVASRPITPDSLPARMAAAVAQRLIQHGARAELRNAKGEDARTVAQESGAPPEILAVLDLG
jgi:ankyrin repeat protein